MADYVCQEVEPLALAPTCRRYAVTKFDSSTLPTEQYFLLRSSEDRWTCSCTGGKNGHDCKHPLFIQLLELHGLIGYMLDSDTLIVHDLFPNPRGRNRPLIDVRGNLG